MSISQPSNENLQKNTPHDGLRHLFSFLGLLLGAVATTWLVFYLSPTYGLFWQGLVPPTFFLLFLNFLPIFLCSLFLFAVTGTAPFSFCLTGGVFLFFTVANNIKISMRQEPVLPTDLTLVKEVLTIVKTFPREKILLFAGVALVFIIILILAFYFGRKHKPSFRLRMILLFLVCLAAYGANHFWYRDKALYESFPVVENPYFQVNQYNSKGLVYSFFHQVNITKVTVPDGYRQSTFDALEAPPIPVDAEKKPNIIMIMGEAFSDLSENENLHFSATQDPLKNFKALANSRNGISGKIVVPNYGGGTSNTEYDVLTGCPTRGLESSLPSYNFVHQPFDALPYRLATVGYETMAIHPGYAWFYNRQNVYPNLGFETSYFLEDSFDLSKQGIGGYISETATMDKIIKTLDQHIQESSDPLFSFTVTIQNHGPYEQHYGKIKQNFSSDIPLTEAESDLLTQYFKGVSDADAQLGRLTDYARNSSEPIVVVYFGDHLPGFSNGMEFFDLLEYPMDANGSLEERMALYQTPYLIWQNNAARALADIEVAAENADLPESGIINAHYLGGLLTELLGMEGLSPLFDFNNTFRKELPAFTQSIYMDGSGNYLDSVPESQAENLAKLKGWQYYKLFDQELPKTK